MNVGREGRRFPFEYRQTRQVDVHVVYPLVEQVAGQLGQHEDDHEWETVRQVACRFHQDDGQTDRHPYGASCESSAAIARTFRF